MAKMAKTKKKKNYRLRKSVRRTLGALFMISAIIVAAIPFPDAAATNGDINLAEENENENQNDFEPIDLQYCGHNTNNLGKPIEESINGNSYDTTGTKKKSYTLVQVGSNLKYEWQYEYVYDASADGAIITDYNNAYSEKNITLAPQVNTETYVSVEQSSFNNYFSDSNTEQMKVTYDNWYDNLNSSSDSKTIDDFKYYFYSRYSTFATKCQKYKEYSEMTTEQKAAVDSDPTYPKSEDEVNTFGVGNVKDIDGIEQKKSYYCEYVLANKAGFSRKTHTLVEALQPTTNTSGEINKVIYILKLTDPAAATVGGFIADDKGFVYSATTDAYEVKGIGIKAFENVKNAMTLVLPDNLLYIADSAFEGSFVTEIVIGNVEQIGNYAFKNSQLNKVTWTDTASTMVIGAEAFYNTNIREVTFPSSLNTIGEGAFAYNKNLTSVSFSDNSKGIGIKSYAFYECNALGDLTLENKQIHTILEGAFAIESVDNGSCTTFTFPSIINDPNKLGDLILAGRSGLKNVKMPLNLGFTNKAPLKEHVFQGCSRLECVEFPDNGNGSSGYVSFDPGMFATVTNPNFYVKGPELAEDNMTKAYPRTSTWACTRRDGSPIPYMYLINGKEFYEISDGTYLKLVDNAGMLSSCEFISAPKNIELNIEGTVGTKTVVGIADGCFSKDFLNYVTKLIIKDDVAIKTIGNKVFAGATKMEEAEIGDLVESIGEDSFNGCTSLKKVTFGTGINSIGARAFKGCSSLTEIIFEQPVNRNDLESFATSFPRNKIGSEAFALNEDEKSGTKLTITGVIHPEYGPFVWAMEPDNFVNRSMGIRVCYKTGAPTYQTVILDNKNNLPTLVDYLHYSDLASIPATYEVIDYGNGIATIDDAESGGNSSNNSGENNNENTGGGSAGNNSGSSAGNSSGSSPTVTTINGWLKDKYEQYPEQLTAMENYTVDAAINLVIPAGIKSIDVKNFIKDSSEITPDATYSNLKNSINVAAYMSNEESNNLKDKVDNYTEFGLFNSDHEDVIDINDDGTIKKIGDSIGNDFIETVKMSTVEYLPNTDSFNYDNDFGDNGLAGGAFYECDNLQSVILGSEMQDIGELPFLGCNNLNSVVCSSKNADGSLKYECTNKIIYENLDDGSNNKKIIQCLGSRGNEQDTKIDTASDSYLSKVSTIADGAFSDCSNLKVVDFRGNSTLKEIPDKAFFNTDSLSRVELPENIRIIGAKAFANIDGNPQIYVYGTEVSMAYDTFDNSNATVHTYKDTAAYNTAEKLLGSEGVEALPEGEPVYKVQFYDYDFKTTIGKEQQVKQGDVAIEPQRPTRTGYKFVGWSTDEWNTGVTKDLDVIAMYETDTTSTGGSGNGGNNNGGSGNGSTNNGTNVNGGIDTNGDGIPDVDKDGNKLYKLTVTNGEGGGYYKAGQTVTIKAGIAPTGAGFAYWSCSNQNLIFEDYTDWTTTLTMIASDVTVICNFRGFYTLEVEYGSGSGSYAAGSKVAISAVEAPQGRKFASWKIKEGQPTIEDSKKATTFITMPTGNVKISATYMDTGKNSVSSNTASSSNNTSVIITKPGISDKDKASAHVSGSSDNFIVKISESLDATDEVQRALQKKYPDMSRIKYFAMDITLYDAKGENKIANTDGLKVNITMPIPDALREYAGNNRVGAVVNGELETLNPKFTTINGVPSISFTATHFSPYTIYVDTGNAIVSDTLDATPKTGDIHPKWFLSLGLACISIILFTKRDRRYTIKA